MSAHNAASKLSRREELGAESRRRIVEAATELMAERGFAGTSIAAVSKRSGLPPGSIYWHFESKEAVLAAVMEEGARRWFDTFPHVASMPADAAGGTAAVLDAAVSGLERHPEFLRLLLLIALERREMDATSLHVIRRVREMALERIRLILTMLLEPLGPGVAAPLAEEFAPFVLCVADGAFVAQHIDPEQTDLRKFFDLMRRSLTALARDIITPSNQGGER
jgi:AcrR family transcriptional regulator